MMEDGFLSYLAKQNFVTKFTERGKYMTEKKIFFSIAIH